MKGGRVGMRRGWEWGWGGEKKWKRLRAKGGRAPDSLGGHGNDEGRWGVVRGGGGEPWRRWRGISLGCLR